VPGTPWCSMCGLPSYGGAVQRVDRDHRHIHRYLICTGCCWAGRTRPRSTTAVSGDDHNHRHVWCSSGYLGSARPRRWTPGGKIVMGCGGLSDRRRPRSASGRPCCALSSIVETMGCCLGKMEARQCAASMISPGVPNGSAMIFRPPAHREQRTRAANWGDHPLMRRSSWRGGLRIAAGCPDLARREHADVCAQSLAEQRNSTPVQVIRGRRRRVGSPTIVLGRGLPTAGRMVHRPPTARSGRGDPRGAPQRTNWSGLRPSEAAAVPQGTRRTR